MKKLNKRLLSLVLAICLVLSLAAPVAAAPAGKVSFTQVDNSAVTADLLTKTDDDLNNLEAYVDTDDVRVSIFLEKESTIVAGFSADSIAANSEAMAYRAGLKENQAKITAAIEQKLGGKLDVVWNLTLAANLISANVKYGQIKAIEAVAGVREVLVETSYEPDVVAADEVSDPNMATSSKQIGSAAAWAAGYTGAGSRIAVIDTGSDTDHQSLNSDAFHYSLAYNAGIRDISIEEYIESLDLLDAEEIAAVADELNAPVGADAYINTKLPFGYNYIDKNLDVTHDNDTQGSHGSHVAGIATANAYVPAEDGFVSAMSSAMVQGVAPDAQLITMKVFGKKGGAYPSDYMAAIEDAIVLGCDSANLSLGSGNPGMSRETTEEYQAILDSLTDAGIVVAMSAGNSGFWAENAYNAGFLYAEDVSMQTNGSPGSYTNSLSVASVENDGKTGCYFSIGDLMVVYNEMLEGNTGAYSNKPFTTIAGDQEYVFIDGFGTAEDWAAVGSALEGKIALCSRGEISFFEKAQYAVEAGAIATFIYNNQAGVINMDLSDYPYTEPCASLTQADGAAVKAVSTPVTDDAGNVLYYTGTMNISEGLGIGQFNSDFYTMSTFSSWGVPGSLEMKPEITAPGGNIYSINGVDKSGTAYETMSGTSMASPQVAGMAAIVAQYIRENGLAEQTGLSARQLAQSLLMSTAEPMLASATAYHSILQQGAGLANVGAAVSADSYITMADGSSAGAADGKVKVELGDDPERTGSYTATFTLNNLTDTEKVFDLGADFFIQAPTSDGVNMYMYTSTALIGADVEWIVDGAAVEPNYAYTGLDINGDGAVNSDDGQAILDYATGAIDTLANMEKADLDADGDVDSYDAYLFLSGLNSAVAVLPAGGCAEVTVNFSLSDLWKDTINYYYPNGTYIQGYIHAQTVSSDEGVAGTCHSIPVLGFFGCWTEASMFDVGNAQVYATGDETRVPYLNNPNANTFTITYANEPGAKYIFGGNPLVADKTYMPERNAINSSDVIAGVSFAPIRNAAASKYFAINETTGETIVEAFPGAVSSAYYYVNGATWRDTIRNLNGQISLANAAEGDQISVGLTLAPEYYVDAEGNVAWDALADGATFGTTMVVDNTAPELEDVALSLLNNNLTVTASDNEYIAAVALFNKAGTEVLAFTGAKQDIAKGESADYTFSMEGVKGSKFLLQVMDYAMNTTTFVVEMDLGGDTELPDMIAFDLDHNHWSSFSKDSKYTQIEEVYTASDLTFYAATIVDNMVLACTDTGDLYVMPESDLADVTLIANTGTYLSDMAYSAADDTIYAVDDSGNLVTVDRLTAETEIVGELGVVTNTLACDANGNFYCNAYGTGDIYTFTLDTMDAPELVVNAGSIKSAYIQSMEIDPNTGLLYWASFYVNRYGYAYLFEIDVEAGTAKRYNDLWYELSALIIPSKTEGESWTAPTEKITDLKLSAETASILKGNTVELTASVLPWTVTDRTVTWSSSDESVATVDENGVVTGISTGTAVITATSNLDASFTASCEVTVTALNITINGTLQDAEGNPMFYSWNMEENDNWVGGTAIDTNMTSATYNSNDDVYYIMDANDNSWAMHVVDPATGKSTQVGTNAAGVPLWDMEYSNWLSTDDADLINAIYYYYLLPGKNPMALDTSAFSLQALMSNYTGGQYLTAVTSAGYYPFPEDDGSIIDTELVIMLDNAGYIWYFWIYPADGGYSAELNFVPTDLDIDFPGDDTGNHMYSSMVVGEDGNLYLSAFTGTTNELFCLTFNEDEEIYNATRIGDVGADVWPATITSVTVNDAAAADSVAMVDAIATVSTEKVSAAELAAVKADAAAGICSVAPASAADQKPVELNSESETAADEKTVTVNVTASEAVTNGVMDITWDTDVLELVSYVPAASYTSVVENENGMTFGYVALTPFAENDTVLSLTFNVKATENTVVTVNNKQLNNAAGAVEEIAVTFEHGNTEIRNAKDATCTEPGYTGDVYCVDCGKLIEQGTVIEPSCPSAKFSDVPVDSWYHDAIDYVVTNGLMAGMSESVFAPGLELNRAQIVTILYALAGSPEVTAPAAFADVPADSFCADAVAWAAANGITSGTSKNLFNPTGIVNRAQMVTFLYKYMKLAYPGITVYGDLSAYTDVADIPDWAVEPLTWAVENGILSGTDSQTLSPAMNCNRAQMAVVLLAIAK